MRQVKDTLPQLPPGSPYAYDSPLKISIRHRNPLNTLVDLYTSDIMLFIG